MRVVDVTQWYSPVSGGIRTYLHAKAEWAAACGRAHGAVVTGRDAGAETVGRSRFLRVRGVTPSGRWGYRVAPRVAPVIAALERLDPAVVVINDALAFPRAIARWAARRGTAVAMVCHSDLALGAAGLPGALRAPAAGALGLVQRRALRVPAAVIVCSEESRRRIAPASPAPVVISELGVDTALFAAARPDAALRATLAPGGTRLLLYAGRLSAEKRVGLLVPMLAALGEGHVLAVAGAGASERALRRAATRAGVAPRLRLLGHVGGRARLATLMASADCFVHPNAAEPFGLAPLEALAAGCRVVAPATIGSARLIAAHGGVLVEGADADALADGVRRALAAPRPAPAPGGDLSWDGVFAREWAVYRALADAA
jgi:alpha-1,6-mannosyltransferase